LSAAKVERVSTSVFSGKAFRLGAWKTLRAGSKRKAPCSARSVAHEEGRGVHHHAAVGFRLDGQGGDQGGGEGRLDVLRARRIAFGRAILQVAPNDQHPRSCALETYDPTVDHAAVERQLHRSAPGGCGDIVEDVLVEFRDLQQDSPPGRVPSDGNEAVHPLRRGLDRRRRGRRG
jgi:hypothetical protein